MSILLEIKDLTFQYKGKNSVPVLNELNYKFCAGQLYAVLGRSGSGKSTLMSLLGGMEKPTKGKIFYKGKNIWENKVSEYRNRHIGMVFQSYNLLEYMNGRQNILTAMEITKNKIENPKEQCEKLLNKVGIDFETANRNVKKISGGEQQRIAIARALGKGADIILADEPTGNLDEDTAEDIMNLFRKISHEDNICIILVTHSKRLAEKADAVIYINSSKQHRR